MTQRFTAPRPGLKDGLLSIADIAALRGTDERGALAFVISEQARCRLVTVTEEGNLLVPQILLDADGELADVFRAVEVLVPLGLDGRELWAWLTNPSGWLSGGVPAEMFATNAARAMTAVRAYASELAVTADL